MGIGTRETEPNDALQEQVEFDPVAAQARYDVYQQIQKGNTQLIDSLQNFHAVFGNYREGEISKEEFLEAREAAIAQISKSLSMPEEIVSGIFTDEKSEAGILNYAVHAYLGEVPVPYNPVDIAFRNINSEELNEARAGLADAQKNLTHLAIGILEENGLDPEKYAWKFEAGELKLVDKETRTEQPSIRLTDDQFFQSITLEAKKEHYLQFLHSGVDGFMGFEVSSGQIIESAIKPTQPAPIELHAATQKEPEKHESIFKDIMTNFLGNTDLGDRLSAFMQSHEDSLLVSSETTEVKTQAKGQIGSRTA